MQGRKNICRLLDSKQLLLFSLRFDSEGKGNLGWFVDFHDQIKGSITMPQERQTFSGLKF